MNFERRRNDFTTNGFCFLEGVIPPAEVERVKENVERDVWTNSLLERPTGYVPGFLRFNQDVAPYVTREPFRFAEPETSWGYRLGSLDPDGGGA